MLKTAGMKKIVFAVALLLALCSAACQRDASRDGQSRESFDITGNLLNGSPDSPVKIEVFSDLQCPGCRELFIKVLQPVMRDYQDKVSVIYYEFPLSGHQYARQAARYVVAADKLGQQKALSVYEAIFSDQAYWSSDGNLEYSVAKALSGEDFQRIRQIMRDTAYLREIDETVEKSVRYGMSKGVNSTPTLFITHGGKEQEVKSVLPTYQVMKQFLDPITK